MRCAVRSPKLPRCARNSTAPPSSSKPMWELLKKKNGATEDEMLEMILAVDMMDGKIDNKPSRLPENCPAMPAPRFDLDQLLLFLRNGRRAP